MQFTQEQQAALRLLADTWQWCQDNDPHANGMANDNLELILVCVEEVLVSLGVGVVFDDEGVRVGVKLGDILVPDPE